MLFKKFQQLELLTLLVMSTVVPTGIYLLHPSFQDQVMATNDDDYQGILPENITSDDLGFSWSANLLTQTKYQWIVNEFVIDGQTVYEGQTGYTSTVTDTDASEPYTSTSDQYYDVTTGTTTVINGTETITETTTGPGTDYTTTSATTSTYYETTEEVYVEPGIPFGSGDTIIIEMINHPSTYYLNSSIIDYFDNYSAEGDFKVTIDDRIDEAFSSFVLLLFILPLNIEYKNQNYQLLENALAGKFEALVLIERFTGLYQQQISKSGDIVTLSSSIDNDVTTVTVEYDYNTGIMQKIELEGLNDYLSIDFIKTNEQTNSLGQLNSIEFYMLGIGFLAVIFVRRKKRNTS